MLDGRRCKKYIQEIANGNTSKLADLYDCMGKQMFAVAYNVLEDYTLSKDAIQESLLKIMNSANTLKDTDSAKAWVLTVTRNSALDIIRKRKNESFEEVTENTAVYNNISENEIDLKNALLTLDELNRQIVIMKCVSGFSHKEIADMLDISVDSCQKRYQRSLEKLREYMGGA